VKASLSDALTAERVEKNGAFSVRGSSATGSKHQPKLEREDVVPDVMSENRLSSSLIALRAVFDERDVEIREVRP
jgi:hypothetical protein